MMPAAKENIRRVQVTGKSTYIVSLPKKWIEEVGIERGETVTILRQSDKSLLIIPKNIIPPEKPTESTLVTSSRENPYSLVRKVISFYLIGYNTIRVITNEERISLDQREMIKEFVRKKLVGTEIVSDSRREMTLQVLLSYPQLSVYDALRRMSIIASSMHRDAITALLEKNDSLAREVIQTDDEVDRFNFYIIRQLKAAVGDVSTVHAIGLRNPRDCLGYRLIARSIERIADHGENIARNVLQIGNPLNERIGRGLEEISAFAISGFDDSVKSLFEKDYSLADNVIERKRKIEAMEEEESAEVLAANLGPESTASLRLILDSIRRTMEYASDISEVVLNLTVLKEKDT
jgi:phosphate uptake regulator